jgi:two-component system, cell cycle response regulator
MELVTLIVTDNDAQALKFETLLMSKNFKSMSVMTIENALTVLEENEREIGTILFQICDKHTNLEGALRKLKKQQAAKYIPFIGVLNEAPPTITISPQLFFHILPLSHCDKNLTTTLESSHSEFKRFRALLSEIESRTSAIGLIKSGKFRVQTLQQAEALTTMLSLACPEPAAVALGLSEILVNAIEHGNLNITFEEKSSLLEQGTWDHEIQNRLLHEDNKDKFVKVNFHRYDDRIIFIVEDQGQGFNWKEYLTSDPAFSSAKHGRGISIASAMGFSSMKYNKKGNKVTASISI